MSHSTVSKKLRNKITDIVKTKKTNVIWSADVENADTLLSILKDVGPYILGVKLHSDIVHDDSNSRLDFIKSVQDLASKFQFLIIEDRKFCDIGNTVKLQSEYITQYADLITVHSISGSGIVDGLRENCEKNCCGILLIAQMSSKNSLITTEYTNKTVKIAQNSKDIVVGFICQEKLDESFLHFTPGIKLNGNVDGLGQQYNTPEHAINSGSDILIVGRGIHQSGYPVDAVKNHIYLKNT